MLTTSSGMVLKILLVADDVPGSCVERNLGRIYIAADHLLPVIENHRDHQCRGDQPRWEVAGG
jgi:hypothetical protein